MSKTTEQIKGWSGDFGRLYTERNERGSAKLDELYLTNFGVTRTALNEKYLAGIDKSARILEVGCNVADQLLCLQNMGFRNLYGIELQPYAVEKAKKRTKNINVIQGSAFDIPFKDKFFDIVFTAGVLIHISPDDIDEALKEIYRCSRNYIWGYEYYADDYTPVNYRGENDLLWKTNFSKKYSELFSDLTLIKEEKIPYLTDDNVDVMYLFKK